MLNLLIKDFKMIFLGDSDSLKKKILSLIFTAVMLISFIVVETFIFNMVINKVKDYSGAAPVFLTLFLFIISCIMIILNLLNAHKLFFNEKDVEQLTRYPVTNGEIISSKLIFLLIMHYIYSLMFVYPIFVSYASIIGRAPMFYFICIFYPLLSFLFEAGVALLLVYPFKLVIDYLKKHILIQFIVALVIMIMACYLYSNILSIFMNLVVNNNLDVLFTTSSIENLKGIVEYFVPISFLSRVYLGTSTQIIPYICISIGIFMLGVTFSIFSFNYFRSIKFNSKKRERKKDLKVNSLNKILIKKELTLLFKDSNNIFSFTGLLIIQPFLMYLVISALNNVFSTGTFQYYTLVVPNFIPLLDIVLVMLFTLIINSGANSYISNEKNTIRIMKTIPVSVERQLIIKVLVPFIASVISLVISTLVLLIFNIISVQTFIFGLILSILLLLIFELISLKEELKIRINKPRSTFLSSLYSYLLPIAFFISALLSTYLGLHIIVAYIIGFVVIILLGIPFMVRLKESINSNFMDLEHVN